MAPTVCISTPSAKCNIIFDTPASRYFHLCCRDSQLACWILVRSRGQAVDRKDEVRTLHLSPLYLGRGAWPQPWLLPSSWTEFNRFEREKICGDLRMKPNRNNKPVVDLDQLLARTTIQDCMLTKIKEIGLGALWNNNECYAKGTLSLESFWGRSWSCVIMRLGCEFKDGGWLWWWWW